MDDTPLASGSLTVTSTADGVLMTIAREGRDPVRWQMRRVGGRHEGALSPRASGFRVAAADEYAGEWHAMSDDETSGELVELVVTGNTLQGQMTIASKGYFSGNVKVERRLALQGTYRNGTFNGEGTGSSYALTAYMRIRPPANGRSATIDGMQLPVTGSC